MGQMQRNRGKGKLKHISKEIYKWWETEETDKRGGSGILP